MKTQFVVKDALTSSLQVMTFQPDQHGALITIAGHDESVLLDVSDGKLRVFHIADDNADVGEPAIQIPLTASHPTAALKATGQ